MSSISNGSSVTAGRGACRLRWGVGPEAGVSWLQLSDNPIDSSCAFVAVLWVQTH